MMLRDSYAFELPLRVLCPPHPRARTVSVLCHCGPEARHGDTAGAARRPALAVNELQLPSRRVPLASQHLKLGGGASASAAH